MTKGATHQPVAMRWATPAEIRAWDVLVADNPGGGHFLQSRAWGEVKRRDGWRPAHIVYEGGGPTVAALYLRRRFAGLGELWYCPKGPAVASAAHFRRLMAADGAFGGAFAARVEPELSREDLEGDGDSQGIVKSPIDVQPYLSTVIVDLTPDEDQILARFKSKTRYNIRLAQRHGVVVDVAEPTESALSQMYDLLATTHDRADFPGFAYRSPAYFKRYWRTLIADGRGELLFASKGGNVLAGVFVAWIGDRAWYKDGGSTRDHANLMAPYVLQWEAMRRLRARGVRGYDLVGVPPRDQLNDTHPHWGLWRFKSGFADNIVESAGTYDVPLQRRRYGVWTGGGERLAHAVAQRVQGRLVY